LKNKNELSEIGAGFFQPLFEWLDRAIRGRIERNTGKK
jgi:hypothetical protein